MKKFGFGVMIWIWMVVLFVMGPMAMGATFEPLSSIEKSHWGATHVLTLTETDLTDTNTATFTQNVTAGVIRAYSVVQPVAMVLDKSFAHALTSAYNTTTFTLGDTSSTTNFLGSTEVAVLGTEVYIKDATRNSPRTYTSAAKYVFAFTGMTNYPLSSYTSGVIRVFVKQINSAD